jgi:hypothetical protein
MRNNVNPVFEGFDSETAGQPISAAIVGYSKRSA